MEAIDFESLDIESYGHKTEGGGYVLDRPMPIAIGPASFQPPDPLMRELSRRISDCGATRAYWFWISMAGDIPHLGLAVAPNDDEVVRSIGQAVEPLWHEFSPHNPFIDILRLGTDLDETIIMFGKLIVPWPGK